MSSSQIHTALLRPAVLQILKAVGFGAASNAVVDSLTDLTAKYLLLVSQHTAEFSLSNHDDLVATVQDVRLALTKAGVVSPQMTLAEEVARGTERVDGEDVPFEDMRGVQSFIDWAHGTLNAEIRRVAGIAKNDSTDVADLAAGLDDSEDYIAAIKKKHSKTAEEARYQGTLLGKDGDIQSVSIAGGGFDTISAWSANRATKVARTRSVDMASNGSLSSALSTPASAATP